jgi:hypothetical protein
MSASISVVSLQNCLDLASQLLGETTTPTSQNSIRMGFANMAKRDIRGIRNWTWEQTYATTDLTASTITYALPTDFKDINAMYSVQISDNGALSYTWPYYAPSTLEGYKGALQTQATDQIYVVTGNYKNGFTLNINPPPSTSVTGGIIFSYYQLEPNFTTVSDTTAIPTPDPIAKFIAAQVLFGYREQAQYQLMIDKYQESIADLAMDDQKEARNAPMGIKSYRSALGKSNNYKHYY